MAPLLLLYHIQVHLYPEMRLKQTLNDCNQIRYYFCVMSNVSYQFESVFVG